MKIAIDCRMIKSSGIGTFIQGILPHILEDETNTYLLIGIKDQLIQYQNHNIKIINVNIPIFSVKELLRFPIREINNCNIFFTPNYNIPGGIKIRVISMIHDVVFLELPDLTNKIGLFIRKYYLKRAINNSSIIITVSKFSEQRITHFFKLKNKISVVYNSIKENLLVWNPQFQSPIDQPYIIFVGNLKKHKGINTLLDAYNQARDLGFQKKLIIAGTNKDMRTKLNIRNTINDNVIFLDYISDDLLYNYIYHADLLIQPSLYEGFGLPPLESLYIGTTVILSDIPVFKEMYHQFKNCHFFEVGNAAHLKDSLLKISPEKMNQKQMILDKYSYKKSALIISDIFNYSI